MKKRLQGLVAGVLIGMLSTGSVAFAKVGTEYIEAVFNNIRIYVDGTEIEPKDATGKKVEPFIYNGTTYLPVRAIGEAVGKTVTWDGETQSVYLGSKPGEIQYLMDVCPPYDGSRFDVGSFEMAGQRYDGFSLGNYMQDNYVLFNLNGKYSSLSVTIAPVDGEFSTSDEGQIINFYLDNKKVKTIKVYEGDYPKAVTIPLKNALQLKIEREYTGSTIEIGFGNITVE